MRVRRPSVQAKARHDRALAGCSRAVLHVANEAGERPLAMNSFRVLLVDDAPDRKQRIDLLKANGLTVFPALKLEQAQERCRPGRYDLIIVSAGRNPNLALAVCDAITSKHQEQLVLMTVAPNTPVPRRAYLVSDRPEILLARVRKLFAKERRSLQAPVAARQKHWSALATNAPAINKPTLAGRF